MTPIPKEAKKKLSRELISKLRIKSEKIDLSKSEFNFISWYDEIDLNPIELWQFIPEDIQKLIQTGCINKNCHNYCYQINYSSLLPIKKNCFCEKPFLSVINKILKRQPQSRHISNLKQIYNFDIQQINDISNYLNTKSIGEVPLQNKSEDILLIDECINNFKGWKDLISDFDPSLELTHTSLLKILKDQQGSRFVQRRLDDIKKNICFGSAAASPSNEWLDFIDFIKMNLPELAADHFANYIVQKLLEDESCHEKLKEYLFKNNVCKLSKETYGCRVVQKGIEAFGDIELFREEIFKNLEELVSDQNANHVVQKIIDISSKPAFIKKQLTEGKSVMIMQIINEIKVAVLPLSYKKFGCRVIQKLLETLSFIVKNQSFTNNLFEKITDEIRALKEEIMGTILTSIDCLATHEYGNYVLQYIISDERKYLKLISDVLISNPLHYSMHKFASNVMENVILRGDEEINNSIFSALTILHEEEGVSRHILFYLAKDKYGNYVIQQLFKKVESKRKEVAHILKLYSNELKSSLYSKHIIYKLSKHGH